MSERGDGWIVFASAALIFAGAMRIIDSIWAFTYNSKVDNAQLPARLQDAVARLESQQLRLVLARSSASS